MSVQMILLLMVVLLMVTDVDSAVDRIFEPRLSRTCDEEVERLRDNWQELLAVAETVYMELIREKRAIYEQELDKQVKVGISVGSRSISGIGKGQNMGCLRVRDGSRSPLILSNQDFVSLY